MNARKIFNSILLGIGNVLFYFILALLFYTPMKTLLVPLVMIMPIFSISVNISIYKKLFLDTKIWEFVFYSTLISLFYIVSFAILFSLEIVLDLLIFAAISMLATMLVFIVVSLLNIIYIMKSFKKDKKIFALIIGILIQIMPFFSYIMMLTIH